MNMHQAYIFIETLCIIFLLELRQLYKNKRKCKYLMPRLYLAKINLNSSIFDAYNEANCQAKCNTFEK